jgi:DNA polymerase-4/DNA polymerase V
MKKTSSSEYPRAIIHVDGDSFFASCEVARNPALKGKPVITGGERGIALAITYEAKRRGVIRGMRRFEILKVCPEAIILPSDYELYSLCSERMYAIVKRYTPLVSKYSIDECFADITGLDKSMHMSYEKIAEKIKDELYHDLGMTFSVGLAPTKVLAKTASNWSKPFGLTFIPLNKINEYLPKLPIGKVWGIGPATSILLNKHGIITAADITRKSETWINQYLSKPYFEIWQELRGTTAYDFNLDEDHVYKSMSSTRTFTPPSKDKSYIFSRLSENIETVCERARQNKLYASAVKFFIKTQDFRYFEVKVKLNQPSFYPEVIIKVIEESFDKIYLPNILYRATGITLENLVEEESLQKNLFGEDPQIEKSKAIYDFVDSLSLKFGKNTVFLGSSLHAVNTATYVNDKNPSMERDINLFKGETEKKRLSLPMLGEAW